MASPEIKQQILDHLRANARISNTEIAERLQMTESDVAAVVEELESEGTIMGYSALCNESNLPERPVRALIEVEVQPEREGGFDRIARRITKFPEVRALSLLSGSYDLLLEVIGPSLHEVATFVAEKLSTMEGIRATRTHFLLKKYKQAGFVLHKEEEHERLKVVP